MVIFPIKIIGSVKVKCSLKKSPKHTVLICNYFRLHLLIASYIHSTGLVLSAQRRTYRVAQYQGDPRRLGRPSSPTDLREVCSESIKKNEMSKESSELKKKKRH